jgi:methyl-accepting chemotaxis protein
MRNLRLPGKLTVLVVALSIPLYLLLIHQVRGIVGTQDSLHRARAAVPALDELVTTFAMLQRLAGANGALLAGDKRFEPVVTEAGREVQASLERVDQHLRAAAPDLFMPTWTGLRERLDALARGQNTPRPDGASATYARAVDELHRFMHDLAERSGLPDVSGPLTRLMADMVLDSSLHMAISAADLRSIGTRVLVHRETADALDRGRVLGTAATLDRHRRDVETGIALLERREIEMPGAWAQAAELVQHLVAEVESRFSRDTLGGSAFAFFDTATVAVEQVLAVQRSTLQRLDAEAARQQAITRHEALLLAAVWALGTLAMAYVVAVYHFSFRGALRQILKGMRATAAGDLSHQMRIRGSDELAEIAQAFDAMSERLSQQTSEIRSRAARVDLSGRQVADGSARLAERTDEQTRSVGNAEAAVAQITQAVAQNAQATRELDALTERLFAQAEEGNAAMAETVMAMDELQNASAKVNEMVSVIDDVAFHTGMLALNASVEAARAGTAGKGFAVVAGEVRQLALRCAEAADTIRGLITASDAKVHDSSGKLQHVSVALDTLVNGVREVSSQLRGIAASSTQQSASLQEVEATFSSLGNTTRDNAALVEESTGAANLLVAQGEALSASVGAMRLRHGSADEARALVERAITFAGEVGRDAALAAFNEPDGRWVDRDLFVFAIDRMGNILANAASPQRVGTSVESIEGLRGTHHTDKLWDKAGSGGGWVRYEIAHPETGVLTEKESWTQALDDQTLLACGFYGRARAGGAQDDMPVRPAAWSRAREGTQLVSA